MIEMRDQMRNQVVHIKKQEEDIKRLKKTQSMLLGEIVKLCDI